MKAEEKILQYIEEFLKGSNLFLVEFKILPRNKAMIILDGDEGVKIEDCAKLSRFISHKMEEENVPELVDALEVSSPGVDYPLKFKRQYPQHLGRTMSIKLADGKLVEGKLKLVDEAEIVLDAVVKLKGKKPSYEEQRIAFSNILESKIKIVF